MKKTNNNQKRKPAQRYKSGHNTSSRTNMNKRTKVDRNAINSRQRQVAKSRSQNKKNLRIILFQIMILGLLLIGLLAIVYKGQFNLEFFTKENSSNNINNNHGSKNPKDNQGDQGNQGDDEAAILTTIKKETDKVIEESKQLSSMYYYDEALAKIEEYKSTYDSAYLASYGPNKDLLEAKSNLETIINELRPFGAYSQVEQVHHIFFHSLIVDTDKAFDGDSDANGYNYYMTTVSEFKEMMRQMYEDGYVLVSMSDLVAPVEQEDGSIKMQAGDLRLPADKKPFVLSQDDVNYYDYMQGDGFASKIVIDEDGRPSTEMILDDGTSSIGDYDIVPIIESFLEEYPDFSYKGARGVLALTGYEGALGYRTNDSSSPTYEEDKKAVMEVARILKEWGWEFACHSWGHRNMDKYNYNFLVSDTNRWLEEVASLVGPTNIYIFPYGIDIEDTEVYSGEKYNYLREKGFLYFNGVYKAPWMQRTADYVRMTRRPLDGQAMLQFPERLVDLFDLSKVIDPSRPPLR